MDEAEKIMLQSLQLKIDVIVEQNKTIRALLWHMCESLNINIKGSEQGINLSIEKYYDECRKKSGGGVTWVGD